MVVDLNTLEVIERLPGWLGRFVHTQSMTFAHYEFRAGATIHEHVHPEEEVYEVLDGTLEVHIAGVAHVVRPGVVAVVPPDVRHFVRAVTDGRVIIVDHPARPDLAQHSRG